MSELSIHTDVNHRFGVHTRDTHSARGVFAPDPFTAAPGQVLFADHLRSVNETDRSATTRERDEVDLESAGLCSGRGCTHRADLRQGSGAILDATLGEVLDVEPMPKAPTYSRGGDLARVSLAGHAGRVIDVVI